MANWCALGAWQKSCRIRVFSYVVSDLDGIESNHDPIALAFWGFRAGSKALGNKRRSSHSSQLRSGAMFEQACAWNQYPIASLFRLRRNCMSFALLSRYGIRTLTLCSRFLRCPTDSILDKACSNPGQLDSRPRGCISVRKSLSLQDLGFLYFKTRFDLCPRYILTK
jgi:hypothetical protein